MRLRVSISLLFLLLLAGSVRAEVTLILRREAKPSGRYVRICDIARVEGPEEQAREVGMTVLGPMPSGGDSRDFSRWDIETRLYEMGVAAKITFSGNDVVRVYGTGAPVRSAPPAPPAFRDLEPVPDRAAIRRRGQTQADGIEPPTVDALAFRDSPEFPVQPAAGGAQLHAPVEPLAAMTSDGKRRVELALSNYLADRYKADGKRTDIEVETKLINVSSAIPYEAHEIRVEDGLDGKVPGKALIRVMVRDTAEDKLREVRVEADTSVYAKALVASRQLKRGDILETHDVVVTRVRMEAGNAYLPPNPKAAVGRELTRGLRAGEPVLAAEAVPGQAIKRGQIVVVRTVGQGWEVGGYAKALGSGMVGDHITVEDTKTKTRYTAKILDRETVSVIVKKTLTISS